VKLNTDVKVTFNPKSKVREINIVTESAALQVHQLYCINLSMRCNGSFYGPSKVLHVYRIHPCLRVGPSLPHLNPLSFLKENNNKSSIGFIKVTTKAKENRNKNYAMEFKNSHVEED
jgi:hypothetical protein